MNQALADLRRKLAALEPSPVPEKGRFTLGSGEIDAALEGGLAKAAIHEVFAAKAGDEPGASGFALALALRAAPPGRSIVWVRHHLAELENGALYGPGLAEFGIDPNRLILLSLRSDAAVLGAGLEALHCSALGAVLIEFWGRSSLLDLTASRRMMLAVSRSGTTGFLLRPASPAEPGAALTRWRVGTLPSAALAKGAPSHPVFDIALERHRAGIRPESWRVEWNRDHKRFDIAGTGSNARAEKFSAFRPASAGKLPFTAAAVPGAVVSAHFDGQAASGAARFRRTG